MKVKKKPGIPLMFIIQNTIVLDKPSPKTIAFVKAVESGQLVSVHEKQSIRQLKEDIEQTLMLKYGKIYQK